MNVLEEAQNITSGDRHKDYGDAAQNWRCTSRLITALIANIRDIRGPDARLSDSDGLMIMVLVKLAREQFRHKRDNIVDMCGYARLISVVAGDEAET